jgi:hypothetical protein
MGVLIRAIGTRNELITFILLKEKQKCESCAWERDVADERVFLSVEHPGAPFITNNE